MTRAASRPAGRAIRAVVFDCERTMTARASSVRFFDAQFRRQAGAGGSSR
jgi:hypothetical protein